MCQAAFLQMLAIELEVVRVCVRARICTLMRSRVFHGGEVEYVPSVSLFDSCDFSERLEFAL